MHKAFSTFDALYGTVGEPVDGDDMTWDSPDPESVQTWQGDVMRRLAKLEAELAAMKEKLAVYEGEL
jgi:hypothetical protein